MSELRNFAAFQGTAMVAQPTKQRFTEIVREERLKAIEYRIGEILHDGGFPDIQVRRITSAVMKNIRLGLELSAENLATQLVEAGFAEDVAQDISENIAAGGKR